MATTTLFGLLVAAVVGTGSTLYIQLYQLVPAQRRHVIAEFNSCSADSPLAGRQVTGADVSAYAGAADRFARCIAPVYHDELSWAVIGLAVLLGLAVILYYVHPRWIIHHGRLVPLTAADSPELTACLARLVDQVGLTKPPVFLVAPGAPSTGGVAFGRSHSHFVRLDAGLVSLFTTDPRRFRAVVLHELAHLANRDVGRTYLTMAIWRSFLAAAVLPVALVLVFVTDASTWSERLRTALALVVLTGLVYVTRNAVLRERETYADATAARHDGTGGVRTAVEHLRPSTAVAWWTALSTHPHPRHRLRAIDDPTFLLHPRLWEVFGAGMVTAVLAANLRYALSMLAPAAPLLREGAAGLLCVAGLGVPLGIAMWRAVGHAVPHRPSPRAVFLPPLALTAGFLLGERVSLINITDQGVDTLVSFPTTTLIAGLVLLAGGCALAGWTASATRTVLPLAGPDRWAAPAVIAAGTLAAAPWFAVWLFTHDTGLLDWQAGDTPEPDGGIGWYATLARWAGARPVPLLFLLHNPLTLAGLLLWLTPIAVLAGRQPAGRPPARHPPAGHPPAGHPASSLADDTGQPPGAPVLRLGLGLGLRLGPAFAGALAGGVLYLPVSAALVYIAKAGLPPAVRSSDDFAVAILDVFVLAAVLVEAGVAAAVVATARRHRAVLVPLAVCLTGLSATATIVFGTIPLARCAGLAGPVPAPCYRPAELAFAADITHLVIVKGLLAAIPAAVLGAAVAALLRRRPAPQDAPHPDQPVARRGTPHRLARPAAATTIAVLLIGVTTATAVDLPDARAVWHPSVSRQPAPAPSPRTPPTTGPTTPPTTSAPVKSTVDPCLVGTWTSVSDTADVVSGTAGTIRFTSRGSRVVYRPDGTGMTDYGTGVSFKATFKGTALEVIDTGTITWTYQVHNGVISYSHISSRGTEQSKTGGVVTSAGPSSVTSLPPDRYTCSGDVLRTHSSTGTASATSELHRTG